MEREGTETTGKGTIVVGVDGSASSIAALRWAAHLVPLAGSSLRAVAVWQYPMTFDAYVPVDWHPDEIASSVLAEALESAFGAEPPRPVENVIRCGSAAQVLIEESKNASMVVVGSRGHGGFTGLHLGSVSSAVAERSHCPV
ncbi:universal stress protein [Arthrobacter roseus]|uniref:universal stress protein n=1 Tax=Arthrobacter roseus TaxID=136274 RepID=UPI0019663819|nr:universal stress protein [Arthrobacter roseus]MBM7848754.1 nucleotide-binding universal stress UspA family protein [Arthrobacter roseus]